MMTALRPKISLYFSPFKILILSTLFKLLRLQLEGIKMQCPKCQFENVDGAKTYHNQLTLNRLSNRENLMMVSHLLGTEELDKRLEAFILEKTEGVPFYIEQLIRSLIDLKIVVREDNRYRIAKDINEMTIPATVQDVIMARIDALPEGTKSLLQKGSVAGREFGNDLIKEVANLPEEELLTHLYSKSDKPEKAFQFLKLSGNKTTRSHSLWEALSFYRQAIEKLKELPETEENKRGHIEVIKLMEMPMRLLGYPEDSLNVILEGEKLLKELRDSQAIAVFSALIGLYYTYAGDAEQAKKYLENCV
jgi:hypothetical protein